MKREYKHLSYEERVLIRGLRKQGFSIREVSKELCRAPSTVSRELNRNEQFSGTRVIYPDFAQMKANGRRHRAYRKPRLKSKRIQKYVERKLRLGWSPEQISGRMKLSGFGVTVSHESIYQYIYDVREDLAVLLTRHHKQRKRFRQSKRFPGRSFPSRTMITERPAEISTRKEFGHWEVDLIVSKQSRDCLQIATERKCRLVKLTKLKNQGSKGYRKALVKRFASHAKGVCKSMTYDNGKENVEHQVINKILGTKSYFCLPYHSWEKGTVENSAGLVRRKYPKKTDFAKLSFQELKLLERQLNNRPRKCLQFKTPMEVFRAECVALQS